MRVGKDKLLPRAKSYTSIYDFFGSTPFNNILYRNTRKLSKNVSVFKSTCGDSVKAKNDQSQSILHCSSRYITSEQYNLLNKDSIKSIGQSTSTLYYDLDEIAKRHSFHAFNNTNKSNVNLLKVMTIPLNTNGFAGKSAVIVQECATQITPRLQPRDSMALNTKKIKRSFPNNAISSEIFLRDEVASDRKKRYYDKEITNRQQKFWSYAKYHTEYTNPIPEEKKCKKKDRGKRTEDPCPCQLFSYACPCSEKKSLTELARSSKCLPVADQVTSTVNFLTEEKKEKKRSKSKKSKTSSTKEHKLLNTEYEMTQDEAVHCADMHDIDTNTDENETASNSKTEKCHKKLKKIVCPKCRENVEVVLSISDDEECLKYASSSLIRYKEEALKSCHGSKITANRHKSYIPEDNCDHDPRCELIPVCQILPTNNVFISHKCTRKQYSPKPKVIRITKACRHHPPCTVVPSCQRANVLKNNCEYIPPCLHRPRCVNLPLCVPLSKTFNYEEPAKTIDELESVECPHMPRCKYYPECQYDPMGSTLENQVNIVSEVQKNCEYQKEYHQPFAISSKSTCRISPLSPNQVASPVVCDCCKNMKSCQLECADCKCNSGSIDKERAGNEGVVFIRDVGCQFRNKKCSPIQSDLSKMSASYELLSNFYSNVHTLRYEDKFTSPHGKRSSDSSISIISYDTNCPTHGEKAMRERSQRTSGFVPKINVAPLVAFATRKARMAASLSANMHSKFDGGRASRHSPTIGIATYPVKSRKSFLRGKYKKIFSGKRRRKPNVSSQRSICYTARENIKYI